VCNLYFSEDLGVTVWHVTVISNVWHMLDLSHIILSCVFFIIMTFVVRGFVITNFNEVARVGGGGKAVSKVFSVSVADRPKAKPDTCGQYEVRMCSVAAFEIFTPWVWITVSLISYSIMYLTILLRNCCSVRLHDNVEVARWSKK
jgi:hypothetical protein